MSARQKHHRPTMVERVIARVAPTFALNRALARGKGQALRDARNHYDSAQRSRRTQHWRRAGDDPNAATAVSLSTLRNVARDMVRNNPYAKRAKSAYVSNVVGAGILPQLKGVKSKRQAERITQLIADHLLSTDIDADGQHNIIGLQALVMGTVCEAGECLVRRRRRNVSDGLALPFQLQVLEPDHLDHAKNEDRSNGNRIIQGIEFNRRGRRVAYWLFADHPADVGVFARRPGSFRVRADDIAHVYWKDRPGQARGVTWFHPIIQRLRDFADYSDAQLVRQKIAACFTAFITGDPEETGADDGDENSPYSAESLEPGMIEYLGTGEDVTFATPPTVSDFDSYATATLHEIATGLNMPYAVLTSDMRRANFASGRLGWLEFQRSIEQWRGLMLVPMMLGRVSGWFTEAVQVSEGYSGPLRIQWVPPRREMINPKEEIAASSAAVRIGVSSRSFEARRYGHDPEELEDEIAEDNARADEKGLSFDSDPRKQSAQGQEQPSASEDETADSDTENEENSDG